MEKLVYEKVRQFLMELRCEDTDRDSMIETESYFVLKEKQHKMKKEIQYMIEQCSPDEQESIHAYFTVRDELEFEKSQQAYLQGFVDCVLVLYGAGIIKLQKELEEVIKMFK